MSLRCRPRLQPALCCLLLALWAVLCLAADPTEYAEYEFDRGGFVRVRETIANQTMAAAQGLSYTAETAQQFINEVGSIGAMAGSSNPNSSAMLMGGSSVRLRSSFFFMNGNQFGSMLSNRQSKSFRLGPLIVDSIVGGAAGMYSENHGYAGFNQSIQGYPETEDKNWAAMNWVMARAGLVLSDRFALVVNLGMYYLPLKDKLGWFAGGPQLGAMAMVTPAAFLQAAYRTRLGENMSFMAQDILSVIHPQSPLMRNLPFLFASFGDRGAVDFAGRHRFGGYGPTEPYDWTGSGRISAAGNPMNPEAIVLQNQLNMGLMGRHPHSVESRTYYQSQSFWNRNFDSFASWQTMGTYWTQNHPSFSPSLRYEISTPDSFRSHYQYLLAGFRKQLGTHLTAYASGGWLWDTRAEERTYYSEGPGAGGSRVTRVLGGQNTTDSWLANAGFYHQLNSTTQHGFEAGRMPFGNLATRYLSTYGRYFISHQINSSLRAAAFVQEADLSDLGGNDRSVPSRRSRMAGAVLNMSLSDRSSMTATVTWDDTKVNFPGWSDWEGWTYQLMFNRRFSESMWATMYYQHQTINYGEEAWDDFGEHLLYMGVNKQF